MILLIDNYDSFSYNLYQLVGEIDSDIRVTRNDDITAGQVSELRPDCIILSPGPGRPEDAGICVDIVRYFAGKLPILGVCLGHQAICAAFGADVTYANTLMHGKQSDITLDLSCPVFKNLPDTIKAGRYHSLSASESTLPPELKVTARSGDGEIMGVSCEGSRVYGLQFHPESILTPYGAKILENFLSLRGPGRVHTRS